MNLTRRQFSKGTVIVLGMGSMVGLAGCDFGSAVDDIENWIPVGEDAVNGIIAILGTNGVPILPAVLAAEDIVNAALVALKQAVKEYKATTPAPVGALAKIQAEFKAVTDSFGAFVQAINLPIGGVYNAIIGIVQIVLETIAGFQQKFPVAPSMSMGAVRMSNGMTINYTPKLRTRRAFKKDYNSRLDAWKKTGVVIPKQAYMHVSFFEQF